MKTNLFTINKIKCKLITRKYMKSEFLFKKERKKTSNEGAMNNKMIFIRL